MGRDVWELFPAAQGSDIEVRYRRAVDTGEPTSFDAYYPPPLDAWCVVRALPTTDGLSVYFLDTTEQHHAREQAEGAAQRALLLGRITDELLRSDEPEDAAARLADLVVPVLADWAVVTLIDDAHSAGGRRGLRTAAAAHADPGLQPLVDAYASERLAHLTDDAVVMRAMETGSPQLLLTGATAAGAAMLRPGPIQDLWRSLAAEHVAIHPLTGRSGPMGIITLCRSAGRGPFLDEDLLTATHVAARAGVVLENARLYRQQRDLAEGLVIGDVVGHDTRAAAAMSQVRTLVRGIGAATGAGPADLLRAVDDAMQTLCVDTTATAVLARVEQASSELARGVVHLRWSNAGHPPPMVITPDATVTTLGGLGADLLLGVMPTTRRHEHEVAVDHGATVLLYTDGLVERRGQSLEAGLELLQATLEDLAGRDLDLDALCDELLARMLPARPEDDVALVAVRLHPQDRPRPAEAGPRRLPDNIPDVPEVVDQP